MLLHVFNALALEFWDSFRMKHQLLQFVTDTFISRLYVDDRTEFGLVDDLIILRFTTTDTDDALRHGQ